jgi:alkylated DNA repair protein alkB family protein 1
VKPKAIFVKSGDIVIMSGHSRYCYHGVARVVEGTCPEYLKKLLNIPNGLRSRYLLPEAILEESSSWDKHCAEFIAKGRLNMNVRQVRIHHEQ